MTSRQGIDTYVKGLRRRLHCTHTTRFRIAREMAIHYREASMEAGRALDPESVLGNPEELAKSFNCALRSEVWTRRIALWGILGIGLALFVALLHDSPYFWGYPTFDKPTATFAPLGESQVVAYARNSDYCIHDNGFAVPGLKDFGFGRSTVACESSVEMEGPHGNASEWMDASSIARPVAESFLRLNKDEPAAAGSWFSLVVDCVRNDNCADPSHYLFLTFRQEPLPSASTVEYYRINLNVQEIDRLGSLVRKDQAEVFQEGYEYDESLILPFLVVIATILLWALAFCLLEVGVVLLRSARSSLGRIA